MTTNNNDLHPKIQAIADAKTGRELYYAIFDGFFGMSQTTDHPELKVPSTLDVYLTHLDDLICKTDLGSGSIFYFLKWYCASNNTNQENLDTSTNQHVFLSNPKYRDSFIQIFEQGLKVCDMDGVGLHLQPLLMKTDLSTANPVQVAALDALWEILARPSIIEPMEAGIQKASFWKGDIRVLLNELKKRAESFAEKRIRQRIEGLRKWITSFNETYAPYNLKMSDTVALKMAKMFPNQEVEFLEQLYDVHNVKREDFPPPPNFGVVLPKKKETTAKPPPPPQPQQQAINTTVDPNDPKGRLRARLTNFYNKYNPQNADVVEKALTMPLSEDALFARLCAKYNVSVEQEQKEAQEAGVFFSLECL